MKYFTFTFLVVLGAMLVLAMADPGLDTGDNVDSQYEQAVADRGHGGGHHYGGGGGGGKYHGGGGQYHGGGGKYHGGGGKHYGHH